MGGLDMESLSCRRRDRAQQEQWNRVSLATPASGEHAFDAGNAPPGCIYCRPLDLAWWTEHEKFRPGCRPHCPAPLRTHCDLRRGRAHVRGTRQEREGGEASPRAEALDVEAPDSHRRQGSRLRGDDGHADDEERQGRADRALWIHRLRAARPGRPHAAHRVRIQRRAGLGVGVAAHGHPRPAPRRDRRPCEQHARSVQARRQRVRFPRSRRSGVDRSGRHRLLAAGRQGRGQAVLGRRQRHQVRLRLHRALSRRVQALGQPEVHPRRKLRRHPHRRRDVRPAHAAQRRAERHHPGFAVPGLRHRHCGHEHRRRRRQLPHHVCGNGLVSQGAQSAPAGAGAVPDRSRAVGRHRLSPGTVSKVRARLPTSARRRSTGLRATPASAPRTGTQPTCAWTKIISCRS